MTQERHHARQYEGQGNKGHVYHGEINRLGNERPVYVPDIGPLEQDDSRVLAEFPVDKAIPDVNGVDALGSPLQETVGETPGRTTDVKRDQTAWIDGERVESRRQFFSGPTDKRGRHVQSQGVRRGRRAWQVY